MGRRLAYARLSKKAVMDADIVAKAIDELESLIGSHIGLLSLADVAVLRPEKF